MARTPKPAPRCQAAYDAGIAFTRSYVGYVHAVAHSLGGQYGVPHGLANAVILPYFLEEYGPSCHKALARLARKAGIAEETSADEPAARAFIAWVWEMNRAMEIPSCIPEIRAADIPRWPPMPPKSPIPLSRAQADGRTGTGNDVLQADAEGGHAMTIEETVARERAFFRTGKTLPYAYRRDALARLRLSILAHEEDINAALRADLNKSPSESYMCEIGMTLSELSHIQKHLSHWMKKRRAPTPLAQFHAKSFTVANPYGVVLIMSPWNYPFMLTMDPLIGAIAAGNCCVVKPSAYSPAVSAVIRTIVSECFPPEYVTVVEGGRAENKALLDQVFDYIFFTGGVTVGKEVMEKSGPEPDPR